MKTKDIIIKVLIIFLIALFSISLFLAGSMLLYTSVNEILKPIETENVSNLTLTQENALARAKTYVSVMGISKKELVRQLELEGYSAEDASFAAINCGANYEFEALEKAESLLSIVELSKKGLAEQLEIEGFEKNEINFALDAIKY